MGVVKDFRKIVDNFRKMRKITEKKYRKIALLIPLVPASGSILFFILVLFLDIDVLGLKIVFLTAFIILSIISTFWFIYSFQYMLIDRTLLDFDYDELSKWR
ncbi:MAG: hypothetical protein KAU62_00680 [Candidatus Heimdallarchaeota archaeon]|nr:hypothetical protein [Candidatus Heimdallarchaeota archaeon]MCK4609647.1 hypothetical protein [Candidatus Heimdallarchaeota archaeon]